MSVKVTGWPARQGSHEIVSAMPEEFGAFVGQAGCACAAADTSSASAAAVILMPK
jgi:hypothetical protein